MAAIWNPSCRLLEDLLSLSLNRQEADDEDGKNKLDEAEKATLLERFFAS